MPVVDRTVVKENEAAARRAYDRGEYVLCFLLAHSLVESLLRTFLGRNDRGSFSDLIVAYRKAMEAEYQPNPIFVDELTKFNQRRNRVVHQLWTKGYDATNARLEPACRAAFITYGLFIEWLETFSDEITEAGFEYE